MYQNVYESCEEFVCINTTGAARNVRLNIKYEILWFDTSRVLTLSGEGGGVH